MKNQNLDLTVDALSVAFRSLFEIQDEHDLVERPVLLNKTIELLDRTINNLDMLAELAALFDPEEEAKHRDDAKFFGEMKMKLLAEQANECHYWLSGTFH